MIVYEATKKEFIEVTKRNEIVKIIEQQFREKVRNAINFREELSWRNSLQYMKNVLEGDDIPNDCGVAIEYKIPNSGNRVDFILSGKNNEQRNVAIIIELKQWQSAKAVDRKDGIIEAEEDESGTIITYTGGRLREVTHPSYQAWSYAMFIENFNESVQNHDIELYPCAYLHNYREVSPPQVSSEIYSEYIERAPLFFEDDFDRLRNFIKAYVKYGDNKETLYLIENGKLRPSKSLQDCIGSMIEGNEEFVLLDEQKVAYEYALDMARKCMKDNHKRCLIVRGGPGTGKTVVAIRLLAALTNSPYNMVCNYVTKNAAVRNVFKYKLKKSFKISIVDNLFKGSGSYVSTLENTFDVIIVDEAHRLNEKSGMMHNIGENQVKEIIRASKLSIFFIDESQRVTTYDIGTINEISKYVKEFEIGKDYGKLIDLKSQFRCNGSDGYLAWLDDILEIHGTANSDGFDMDYDIRIVDNPNELRELIVEKNKSNNKSRMVAGYCWDWITKKNPNGLDYDITIPEYDFKMKWNFNNTSTWAIDEKSVNEVGCIHTSQGLEFDYVGVIIGDDLRFENGRIITDFTKRASTDQSLKGIKTMYKTDPERAILISDIIIKNTYRTLMTRGQKGCYIYCTDKKLYNYLKEKIK